MEQADEDTIKKVVKVTMGNDLELLDVSESSGKTAGEVQKVTVNTLCEMFKCF